MISRRSFLALGAAGAAGAAGCAARPAPPASDATTLRFGSAAGDDHTYDPRITMTGSEEQVIVQVFDRLLAKGADGGFQPYLARAWQVAPDARAITLQLRDDVIFHDGTKFDAEAVKYTFDTIVDPKTGSMGAVDVIGPYAGADILGPHEVRLRFASPFPRVLSALADNKASIVSPTAARRLGVGGFGQAPVGSGPFRFVSWQRGVQVVLARNPDYRWGPGDLPAGPPRIAKVVHRFIPNAWTRIAALDAGEIDACEQAPPLDLRRMTMTGRYRALAGDTVGVPFGFSLNTSRGPFADVRVRRAFMTSVNRPWIAENLLFGQVHTAWGPLASSAAEYWPGVEAYYPFDLAAAGQLLDQAGWRMGPHGVREKAGRPLAIYLPILLEPQIGVALQAFAKRAGFDFKIEQVTHEKQEELIFANAYDLLSLHWTLPDAGVLEVPFLSSNIPGAGRFSFNWSRYQSPVLDKLLVEAAASPAAQRAGLYHQVQKTIMDQAIFLPIHQNTYNVVHATRLSGLRLTAGNSQTLLAGAVLNG